MPPDSHNSAHEAIMGGLIRRGLGGSDEMPAKCPDPGILAAYYDGSLDADERAQFETHLSRCAPCREQIAAMVRAEEKPSPAVRNTWTWDWRWLAPAVAALLIVSVWAVRRSETPERVPNGKQPLVAMSRPPQPPETDILPLPQPPADSSPSAQSLVAPESNNRTSPKLDTQQHAKAPAMDHAPRTFQAEKQATAPNSPPPSAAENEPKVAQKSNDESSAVADLKKALGNPAAAPSAGAPPAVGQPAAGASGPPAESPAETLQAPARNQNFTAADALIDTAKVAGPLRARQSAPPMSPAVAGALAQAAEQRSGSTIIPTPDPKILWRIAGGNFVERTENGGATWRGQVADPDAQLTAGSAPTNKTCWLVGKDGVIVVTKDATHWKKLPPPVPADFIRVEAKNSSSAIVTAADGQKFSTENEGKKWVPAK